ncbi:hypothetical protein TNIN_172211 [Trichonephila inaurata madagascariensis]|uniref:Uncharacterized protein n=1 Tax=Trichonephila inaurata madagascariensis TaxID=2747483 RepID=A0A8X6WWN5_9ARAC|nr:hypothetical protein TNIN_172211 [Trichonephila inaurata madagascariensis]
MPPQCYRCQEFFHHSRLCNRAPNVSNAREPSHRRMQKSQNPQQNVKLRWTSPSQFQDAPTTQSTEKQSLQLTNLKTFDGESQGKTQKATPHQQKATPTPRQWRKYYT